MVLALAAPLKVTVAPFPPAPLIDPEICGCMLVPLSEIAFGELVALLMTLRLPVALPAEAGAKLTVSGKFCPGASVTFPEKPLTANPAPVMTTCETLTGPCPLFWSASPCEAEVPTGVLLKFTLFGLAWSKYVDKNPCPETEIVWVPPPLWPSWRTMLPL